MERRPAKINKKERVWLDRDAPLWLILISLICRIHSSSCIASDVLNFFASMLISLGNLNSALYKVVQYTVKVLMGVSSWSTKSITFLNSAFVANREERTWTSTWSEPYNRMMPFTAVFWRLFTVLIRTVCRTVVYFFQAPTVRLRYGYGTATVAVLRMPSGRQYGYGTALVFIDLWLLLPTSFTV